MALTAAQILEQRMARDKNDTQMAFQTQWDSINRQYGPVSRDPKRETARQRALKSVHSQFQERATSLVKKYKDQMASFGEIDAMAQQGMLAGSNPEELKMRQVMPAAVAKAAFPTPEGVEEAPDPLAEYGKFHTQRQRVRSSLGKFENVGARPKDTFSQGRKFNWYGGEKRTAKFTDPGGVGSRPMIKEASGFKTDEKTGDERTVYNYREATPAEIREWAELTEADRALTAKMSELRNSEPYAVRMTLAALKSPRMGGARDRIDNALRGGAQQAPALSPDEEAKAMSEEELQRIMGGR